MRCHIFGSDNIELLFERVLHNPVVVKSLHTVVARRVLSERLRGIGLEELHSLVGPFIYKGVVRAID